MVFEVSLLRCLYINVNVIAKSFFPQSKGETVVNEILKVAPRSKDASTMVSLIEATIKLRR